MLPRKMGSNVETFGSFATINLVRPVERSPGGKSLVTTGSGVFLIVIADEDFFNRNSATAEINVFIVAHCVPDTVGQKPIGLDRYASYTVQLAVLVKRPIAYSHGVT